MYYLCNDFASQSHSTVPSQISQVTKWPKCRDSRIIGCEVSSGNPVLPSDSDLLVSPMDVTIPIGEKVDVQCSNPSNDSESQSSLITDAFVSLKLVSNCA